jgi:hypothetical protein
MNPKTAVASQQDACFEKLWWPIRNDFVHDVFQQGLPSVCRRQLLRDSVYMTQGRSDIGDQQHQGGSGCVHRG